jgi:hypothetical protein
MRAALLAEPATGAQDNAALTKVCDAIATTVLAHIVANAALVTACPAGAGTGTVT